MSARPYSRTRRHGDLVLCAGVLGRGADGELVTGGIAAELEQALDNLASLLEGEGVGLPDVLRLVVYVTDLGATEALDEVFARRFPDPRPVRTTVQVAGLPAGARVEVEATAGC